MDEEKIYIPHSAESEYNDTGSDNRYIQHRKKTDRQTDKLLTG